MFCGSPSGRRSIRRDSNRLQFPEEGLEGDWCDADGFELTLVTRADDRLHCVTSNSRVALLQLNGSAYTGKEVCWNSGAPLKVQLLPRGSTLEWRKWNAAACDWFAPRVLHRPTATEAAARGPYVVMESLWEALNTGDTVLLRGSWLVDLCRSCALLPRRQDLPQGAAWEPDQLRSAVEAGAVRIVALSYCWRKHDHPDPQGEHLQRVAGLIERRLAYKFPDDTPVLEDLAVFWDYPSLLQEPRSTAEQEAFDRSISNVNLWYAHSSTEVWMLTQALPGGTSYSKRGWPTFERAVSGFITPGDSFLDMGLWEGDGPRISRKSTSSGRLKEEEGWAAEARRCRAQRDPPLRPERAAELLATKTFTHGADFGKVLRLYERTYREVLGSVRSLNFFNLPEWGDREAKALAECLPDCPQLKELNLSYDNIGPDGAAALGAVAAQCGQLRAVYLTENPLGDEGALALLPGLASCPALEMLMLSATGIGDLGASTVAATLKRCPALQVICVDRCRIADAGAAALGDALSQHAVLEKLQISGNCISERAAAALRTAWVRAGKEHANSLALGFEVLK